MQKLCFAHESICCPLWCSFVRTIVRLCEKFPCFTVPVNPLFRCVHYSLCSKLSRIIAVPVNPCVVFILTLSLLFVLKTRANYPESENGVSLPLLSYHVSCVSVDLSQTRKFLSLKSTLVGFLCTIRYSASALVK